MDVKFTEQNVALLDTEMGGTIKRGDFKNQF